MFIRKPQESNILEERSKIFAAGERSILMSLEREWPIYFL